MSIKIVAYSFILGCFFLACNNQKEIKPKNVFSQNGGEFNRDTRTNAPQDNIASIELTSFKNARQISTCQQYSSWVEIQDSTTSLVLHFNLNTEQGDTLSMSYSAECWLMFPFVFEDDKIEVLWDKVIDTKYNFDIVKAIENTDEKYLGKKFMVLELVNDTTLKATYPYPELINRINRSSRERVFFPDKFYLNNGFFL